MKNRAVSLAAAALIAVGLSSVSASAEELILTHVFGVNSLENKAAMRLADTIKEKSGGKYTVSVFPASQLGGFTEMVQQMRTGTVHLSIISTVVFGSIDELLCLDAWPFMFDSREEFERGYRSEAGQAFLKEFQKLTGIVPLTPFYKSFRQIAINRDANTLDDLKGLKIRMPGFNMVLDSFKNFGIAPTPMAVSEMFTAMQQGVVNGVEWEMQNLADIGIQEVAKTLVVVNYSAANYVWPMPEKFFNSLPPEDQKMITDAAQECASWFSDEVEGYAADAYKKFEEAKVKIIKPDTSEWRTITNTVLAKQYPKIFEYADAMSKAGKAK
ncbi:MAG: TRAP transporter substrate-binding protein [Methylobacteriaceae bacterium]|nr:TRAP transporter substrate-binding protein [Methylobacteriaceae bacterium]